MVPENAHPFVNHSSRGQPLEMREAQTSLLATHFDSANGRLRDRPRRRPIANKRCRIIRHFFSVFSRMGVAREVTAARSGSPHGGRRGGRHGPLSAAGRASSPDRRRLGKRMTTGGVHAGGPTREPMTPTSAPGTGRDRCLTIRGRRGRRKTRKILDNDPAGCYIQGPETRNTPVSAAHHPRSGAWQTGRPCNLWGALPVRPLPETSPRHAPCPLPPRSGGPLGPPAPPVSPRPAALGHRPRRARGWPPAPRRLGDPPRGPAGLGPCRGAPGGRGACRARRGRWRTRDLQRATGGASAPPGVRRPAAPRLRHATALAGAVSVRDGPCGGVPHPALARAGACPHAEALALAGQEPGALARPGALANPTPPMRPVRATPPAPPVAAASCGTSSCPAAPAGRRPPPVPARLTAGRRLPALRPAGLRQPVPPVPPKGSPRPIARRALGSRSASSSVLRNPRLSSSVRKHAPWAWRARGRGGRPPRGVPRRPRPPHGGARGRRNVCLRRAPRGPDTASSHGTI